VAKANGFSLHAGVAAKAHQRHKLERLYRYIARPAVATDRLALTAKGDVRFTLKRPRTATAPPISFWNHSIPWRIRPQQQTPFTGYTGQVR